MNRIIFLFFILPFLVSGQKTFIPDDDFEQALINLDLDNVLDDSVNTSAIDSVQSLDISNDILKEDKKIIEDLIIAAHNNAKSQLKTKTSEEISKATGGLGIPGFKWPL